MTESSHAVNIPNIHKFSPDRVTVPLGLAVQYQHLLRSGMFSEQCIVVANPHQELVLEYDPTREILDIAAQVKNVSAPEVGALNLGPRQLLIDIDSEASLARPEILNSSTGLATRDRMIFQNHGNDKPVLEGVSFIISDTRAGSTVKWISRSGDTYLARMDNVLANVREPVSATPRRRADFRQTHKRYFDHVKEITAIVVKDKIPFIFPKELHRKTHLAKPQRHILAGQQFPDGAFFGVGDFITGEISRSLVYKMAGKVMSNDDGFELAVHLSDPKNNPFQVLAVWLKDFARSPVVAIDIEQKGQHGPLAAVVAKEIIAATNPLFVGALPHKAI